MVSAREKAYDFRKRLLQIHEKELRDRNREKKAQEYEIKNGCRIGISDKAGEVIKTAVYDFTDYLRESMGVYVSVVYCDREACDISVRLSGEDGTDLGEYAVYRGFRILTESDGIQVTGFDERGAAQALYYLEDLMSFEKAPVISQGKICKKPLFSPQMIHSAYGWDEYPEEYLARVAHEGRDAILVFTRGANQGGKGYMDFNHLIRRAARYGLDVYAYSYIVSNMSPEAPEAEEFYEETYGKLFRECPGLKGVTLVGESVEFPSKDPHVAKGRYFETSKDGIPSDKPSSGWYPCYDYPVWLNLLKRIVRKYRPDADIVFWSYNWGSQPEEARLKLIESLPTDISLQATFEMSQHIVYGESVGRCADYTLAFEGPGTYFASEAGAAAKRGIRLYSMTNSGGRTWDFGTAPYEPMPYQWIRRYAAMRKAHDDWGLTGIMECHHFGFTPSFITRLSKHAFLEPREDMESLLLRILTSEFGRKNLETVDEALKCFSEGIRYYTPSDADQYGAYRVGPAYPFCLTVKIKSPQDPEAKFGNRICYEYYKNESDHRISPAGMRVKEELAFQKKMLELFEQGLEYLRHAPEENEKLCSLRRLCHFLINCVKTGIHAKEWYLLTCRMNVEDTREGLRTIFDRMEELLREEIRNAEDTIPLVEEDSALGFEPSMLYMTDRWHLEWKIRQVNYVIDTEIGKFRRGLEVRL